MAEPIRVDNGALTDYDVLVDDVVDATLGTGAKQLVGLTDATIGATTKVAAGGGVEANALRVTVASDSTGVLSVDDNGATLSVDDGAGSLTVDGSVSLAAAIPAGTNNIGDVDVLSSALPTGAATLAEQQTQTTALQLLDDTVATDGAAAPTKGLMLAGTDGTNAQTVKVDAGGELQIDVLSIAAGDNNIGNVDLASAIPAGTNNIGDVDVLTLPALPAGTNNIGDVDVVSSIPGTGATNLGKAEDAVHGSGDTGVYVLAVRDTAPAAHSGTDGDYESLHVSDEGGVWSAEVASSQGGTAVFRSIDLDETEEDVKTSAGSLYGWHITNTGTATVFVKLYNATAANVIVGTTAPVMTIPVAGNASDDISANMAFSPGIRFDTAICAAATTGVADNDTGAPAANQVIVNLFYK